MVDNHHLSQREVAGAGEGPLAGKVLSSEMPLLVTKKGYKHPQRLASASKSKRYAAMRLIILDSNRRQFFL